MTKEDKAWTDIRLKLKYWYKEPRTQEDLKKFIATADKMFENWKKENG